MLLAALLAATAVQASAQTPSLTDDQAAARDARANCAVTEAGDAYGRKLCYKIQGEDRRSVQAMMALGAVEHRIGEACLERSPGIAQGVDWLTARSCVEWMIKRWRSSQ